MNLLELRTFLAIVECGSLVKASERLNVTQSTVTARLKGLEDEIGQTLIIRQKSGAMTTPAGQRLQRYAQTISELWQQAQQETSLPDALSSICNIGCEPDLWPGFGDQMLKHIKENLPNVATSVWQGSQTDLASWLQDGLIDVALGFSTNSTQKQDVIPAIVDELVLVSTLPESPIKFDPNYIYVEAGEEFGRQHAAAYADANIAQMSFGSAVMALDYMLQSDGTAYLPRRIIERQLAEGVFHTLDDAPVFERRSYIVVNQTARMSWPWFDDCIKNLITSKSAG
ncbi:MAG: LysR family transcriptional regulator [Rhizobiaceae bacterium]|nr:LysR family transcriptional regulator [Rhizobiaceae bacterium]